MSGPCMCGDIMCPSCGPAQGNYKCMHCGAWSMDGGCKDPQKCAEADRLFVEAEIKMNEELDKAGREYWENKENSEVYDEGE